MEVAIGIVINQAGQILVSKRPEGTFMPGYWEFPGGKVEAGESVSEALRRELKEEVGIKVLDYEPLITFHHAYLERAVHLHACKILTWQGQAKSQEGQSIDWVSLEELANRNVLPANAAIINAIRLPHIYWVTPDYQQEKDTFEKRLDRMLAQGIKLIRFRSHALSNDEYTVVAQAVIAQCHESGASVLLDRDPALVYDLNADGLHLTRHRLLQPSERPIGQDKWLAASCHNQAEVRQANRIGVDFMTISPIHQPHSHPDAQPLGWLDFLSLNDEAKCPVYALGGLTQKDLKTAQEHGAQGVCGIKGLSELPQEV